jgi:hypothetical protein
MSGRVAYLRYPGTAAVFDFDLDMIARADRGHDGESAAW